MSWLAALEGSAAAAWVRDSSWGYPAVEVVHLLGLALLVGSATMWDLRLLGVARRIPVSALAGYLLPGARVGFTMMVASGSLLFASDAVALSGNLAFRAKLVVIVAALVNIAFFHARAFRFVTAWDVAPTVRRLGRGWRRCSRSFARRGSRSVDRLRLRRGTAKWARPSSSCEHPLQFSELGSFEIATPHP